MTDPETIALIAEHWHAGKTAVEGAKALGINPSRWARGVRTARDAGLIPQNDRNSTPYWRLQKATRDHGITLGKVGVVMLGLEPHVREWVIAQTPVNSSIADLLAAMAVDAYHDDHAE